MKVENVRFRIEDGTPLLFDAADTCATMIVNARCSSGQTYVKVLLRTVLQFDPKLLVSNVAEGERMSSTEFLETLKLQ